MKQLIRDSMNQFVEHIDAAAVKALTAYHDEQIKAMQVFKTKTTVGSSSTSLSAEASTPLVDVLDVCSSWVSHISQNTLTRTVAAVGMNEFELKENKKLTEFVVQDLNIDPKLPFPDKSFDIVLLQLSIDYLTQPMQVLREIRRVLRDNGVVYIRLGILIFI